MWVLGGGTDDGSHFNDVWSSPDGTNWTEVTAAAPWSIRDSFGGGMLNGRMWVFGGYSGYSNSTVNDVWSSSDGTNWTEVTAAAPWGARGYFTAVVFNGQMWVLGGSVYWNSAFTNDVWSTTGAITTATNNVPVQLGQFYLFQKQ
jgi:hypothetical protein